MAPADSNFWIKARQAQAKLANRFLFHPQVRLIDIGHDPEGDPAAKRLVLRVHLWRPLAGPRPDLPEEIDGIPVRVVTGDYQWE